MYTVKYEIKRILNTDVKHKYYSSIAQCKYYIRFIKVCVVLFVCCCLFIVSLTESTVN